jgi:hypothetical protein
MKHHQRRFEKQGSYMKKYSKLIQIFTITFRNIINFKLYLNFFRIFKSFGHTIMVVFPSQDVQIFL